MRGKDELVSVHAVTREGIEVISPALHGGKFPSLSTFTRAKPPVGPLSKEAGYPPSQCGRFTEQQTSRSLSEMEYDFSFFQSVLHSLH